jgi:hypothetical protein
MGSSVSECSSSLKLSACSAMGRLEVGGGVGLLQFGKGGRMVAATTNNTSGLGIRTNTSYDKNRISAKNLRVGVLSCKLLV